MINTHYFYKIYQFLTIPDLILFKKGIHRIGLQKKKEIILQFNIL